MFVSLLPPLHKKTFVTICYKGFEIWFKFDTDYKTVLNLFGYLANVNICTNDNFLYLCSINP